MSTATATPPARRTPPKKSGPVAVPTPTPELEALAADIRTRLSGLSETNVRERLAIGRKLNEARADTSGRYGADPVSVVLAAVRLTRDSVVPMMKLAETFNDADVDTLLSTRHPDTGETLTWTHFLVLARVKDRGKAIDLGRRAVTEGMSSKDLHKAAIRLQGRKSSKGRPPKKPTTLAAALEDVRAKTLTWSNAANMVWLETPGGLAGLYAAAVGADKATAEVVADLDRTIETVEEFMVMVRAVLRQVNALSAQATASRAPRSKVV